MHSLLILAALLATPPEPIFPDPPAPKLPAIITAAKSSEGVKVQDSRRDDLLVKLAQQYADEMASIDSQSRRGESHFGVEKRYAIIRQKLGMKGNEVSAESWSWQTNYTPVLLWREMFDSWRKSPGHWAIVSKRHDRFGEGLAKSRRGIWYACVLVADSDTKLMAFTADWCAPCQQMHPIIEQLESEGVQVEWVDVDKQPTVAAKYKATSIPLIVVVRRGREIARHVGFTTATRLREMMR